MSAAALSVLEALLRTTLVLSISAVLIGSVLRLTRAGSPAVHRACWIIVLVQGWLFVGLPLAIPWYKPLTVVDSDFTAAPPPLSPSPVVPGVDLQSDAGTMPTAPPAELVPRVPEAGASEGSFHWPITLAALWATGIVACIGVAVFRYAHFVRRLPRNLPVEKHWRDEWKRMLADDGVKRDIPLYVTRVLGPMLCRLPSGYRLVVPAKMWKSLSKDARLGILRHELAHYQRGDLWKSLVARLLALPHWFNPLTWWAVRRFDECSEWACDARAVDRKIVPTTVYARTLLRLGAVGAQPSYHFGATGRSALTKRIRRLLRQDRMEDSTMKKALVFACLICLVFVGMIRFNLAAREPAGGQAAEASLDELARPPERSLEKTEGRALPEEMVKVARQAYEASSAAFQTQSVTLDWVIHWSRQLLNAERRVAKTKEDQIAALRSNRDRIKKLYDKISAQHKVGAVGGEAAKLYQTEFYLAEAEYLLQVTAREEEQVKALGAYRNRMKELHERVAVLYNAGDRGGEAEAYHTTKYWLLEAEYRLEQAKK